MITVQELVDLRIFIDVTPDGNLKLKRKGGEIPEDVLAKVRESKAALIEELNALPRPRLVDAPREPGGKQLCINLRTLPRYRWWDMGQSLRETLIELGASPEVLRAYCDDVLVEDTP